MAVEALVLDGDHRAGDPGRGRHADRAAVVGLDDGDAAGLGVAHAGQQRQPHRQRDDPHNRGRHDRRHGQQDQATTTAAAGLAGAQRPQRFKLAFHAAVRPAGAGGLPGRLGHRRGNQALLAGWPVAPTRWGSGRHGRTLGPARVWARGSAAGWHGAPL